MDLRELKVGDLVKFTADAGDGPAWEWFKVKDDMLNFNVGLVTQIINPVPERQQFLGEAEVRGEGIEKYAIDYNDVRDYFMRNDVQIDKLENICFIYHLYGPPSGMMVDDHWNDEIILRSKRVYTDTENRGDIFLSPEHSLRDSFEQLEKLLPEEIEEFKDSIQKNEKECGRVMKNDTEGTGVQARQCKEMLQFIELIKNYATAYNPQQGDPDTTSSSSGMSTRKKAMIGAAGLAGLGAVALGNYLSGGKKKKKRTKRKKTKRRGTKRRRTKKRKSHKKYN